MLDARGRNGVRIGLITDIHANLEALEAVLEDIDAEGVDQLVCLGDVVGYGADPVAVVERVARLAGDGMVVLKGNHDAAVGEGTRGMSETAAIALAWTASRLGPVEKAFLENLPLVHEEGEILYVHASAARPETWIYVRDAADAAESFAATDSRVIFSGHTHVPVLFHTLVGTLSTGKMLSFRPVADKPVPLSRIRRYHAVIGAVGQPRDGDPRACWGLYDTTTQELTWNRVPYDVEKSVRKITDAGLPEMLARRLMTGR